VNIDASIYGVLPYCFLNLRFSWFFSVFVSESRFKSTEVASYSFETGVLVFNKSSEAFSASLLVSLISVSPFIFYSRVEFKKSRSLIKLAYPCFDRDIILHSTAHHYSEG